MSRPTRFERRKPLVCTAKPSDSSHSCKSMICVERPEPSMPSITIRLPVISLGSNPTRGSPKKYCVPLSSEAGAGFGGGGGERESGGVGKRVDLGGGRVIKKKKKIILGNAVEYTVTDFVCSVEEHAF